MIAREESCPPDASAASTPVPAMHTDTPPPPNRKRKHAAISSNSANRSNAASPAPSDSAAYAGAGAQAAGGSVLPTTESNTVIDNRPRLTVSRPPVFVPINEGSIYHNTEQIAVNRLGFRYVPAGLSEPGSRLLYRTIESYPPGYVRTSWEDRSPFVKVTTDGLGLCGDKGWRSARLNTPIREGKWYLEIKVELGGGDRPPESTLKEGAHVRLGWGRREAGLNCPVGLDGYSYGYLDKDGRKVTLSRPRPYAEKFGTGDVIGMYISLPPKRKPKANDPYDPARLKRERIAIDFKGQAYFESVEYPQSKEMIALMDSSTNKAKDTASLPSSAKKSATVKNLPERGRGSKPLPEPSPLQPLPTLRGSHIAFFVNGKCQGIAFQNLYDYLQLRTIPSARHNRSRRRLREGYVEHTENPFDDGWLGYYPFISLFNGARVRINAGPDFEYPPPPDIEGVLANDPDSADHKTHTWRPLCERYSEFMQEQWDLDARDEAEAQKTAAAAATAQESPVSTKKERAPSDHPKHTRPPTHHSKASKKVPLSAAPSPKRATSLAPPEPIETSSPLVPQSTPKLESHTQSHLDIMMKAETGDTAEASLHTPVPVPDPTATSASASASTSAQAPAPAPEPGGLEPAQEQTPEMTEQERKIEARRQRKRELERARRAKKREEKLALKKQEEEQKHAAAILAAAVAALAAENSASVASAVGGGVGVGTGVPPVPPEEDVDVHMDESAHISVSDYPPTRQQDTHMDHGTQY